MPPYNNSLFPPLPEVAIPGVPSYFYGSFPRDTDDTYMRVSNVALTTNVASVTGTIYRGNIPAVGNWISIQGTTSTAGLFNVSQAVITGVSGTPSTGVYTITFALTHANVTSAADSGLAIIPIAEVPETLANGTSVAIYVPSNELRDVGERSITISTSFPSLPTAATVTLYTAINNNPQSASLTGEWSQMVGPVATVAGGVQSGSQLQTYNFPAGRFFRVVVSGVSGGTLPSIVCKMIC